MTLVTRVTRAPGLAIALALGAACSDPDPCEGIETCLVVNVTSATVERIDQLELDVLYGERHGTTTTQADGGRVSALPLATGIELVATTSLLVGVVAAGKLSGVVLGTRAASATIEPGARVAITIELAEPATCDAGRFYCGGDMLAGDPKTVYECNGGGVPLARGRCLGECFDRPGMNDICLGVGGPCVENSDYCGGDKVDGDPKTLYRCVGGLPTNPRPCPDRCIIVMDDDDECR